MPVLYSSAVSPGSTCLLPPAPCLLTKGPTRDMAHLSFVQPQAEAVACAIQHSVYGTGLDTSLSRLLLWCHHLQASCWLAALQPGGCGGAACRGQQPRAQPRALMGSSSRRASRARGAGCSQHTAQAPLETAQAHQSPRGVRIWGKGVCGRARVATRGGKQQLHALQLMQAEPFEETRKYRSGKAPLTLLVNHCWGCGIAAALPAGLGAAA